MRKKPKLSINYSDSKYSYGEITYHTKVVFGADTGLCGTMLREIEERHNSIVTCPEKKRTGKLLSETKLDQLRPLFLGEMGLVCKTGRDVPFQKIHQKCNACATKIRIIDAPYANIYMFMELVICAMSLGIGYRTEADFESMYGHAASGHSFNPDEIDRNLFSDPKGNFEVYQVT